MEKIKLGYALCGSFCTIKNSLSALKGLAEEGYDITPIMSDIVYSTDTRFIASEELKESVEAICGKRIIHTIKDAEPIGPKGYLDGIVVCPCTGNTLSKIALGVTDTPVTMAVKAQLRNGGPVVLAIATNDALGATAKNIGLLNNTKDIFLVPYRQDDPIKKATSLVSDFTLLSDTLKDALKGKQKTPVVF